MRKKYLQSCFIIVFVWFMIPGAYCQEGSPYGSVVSTTKYADLRVSFLSVKQPSCPDDVGAVRIRVKGGEPLKNGEYRYHWSNGVESPDNINLSPGHYYLTVYDANNQHLFFDTVIREPQEIIITRIEKEFPYCNNSEDGRIELIAEGNEPLFYRWADQENNASRENLGPGKYEFTITDANGCRIDSMVELIPERELCFDIPSAFTPNGDGINDRWKIERLSKVYPDATVKIFDRRGKMLYYINSYSQEKAWNGMLDGHPLPMDSYHYVIYPGKGIDPIVGYITLIR